MHAPGHLRATLQRTACCCCLLAVLGAHAAAPPTFRPLRFAENWAQAEARAALPEPLRGLKQLPFAGGTLDLGGETRTRFEYYTHTNWGAGPQDSDGFWLQRLMLHADLHWADGARAFVDFKSGFQDGRSPGPLPTDRDRFDLHQAFVEFTSAADSETRLGARLGRREFYFGSGRLVANRGGPNVRQSFEAVTALAVRRGWTAEAFFAQPVDTRPGAFDNRRDSERALWGFYATRPPATKAAGHGLDVYYLGFRNRTARFDSGRGAEQRHTLGLRWFGQHGAWDWNHEFIAQGGRFAGRDILAGAVSLDTGFRPGGLAGKLRLGLKTDAISGDSDPQDGRLGTFNAMYARFNYFGDAALLAPANLLAAGPALAWSPRRALTLGLDAAYFLRASVRDGVYAPPGVPARAGASSQARSVGTQLNASLEWRPISTVELALNGARFFAGDFIAATPPGRDATFFAAQLLLRF